MGCSFFDGRKWLGCLIAVGKPCIGVVFGEDEL